VSKSCATRNTVTQCINSSIVASIASKHGRCV